MNTGLAVCPAPTCCYTSSWEPRPRRSGGHREDLSSMGLDLCLSLAVFIWNSPGLLPTSMP